MPQLRQNIITGDWVVIAPERAKRPNAFHEIEELHTEHSSDCVFCPESDEYKIRSLKKFETELSYVIPNKFPAFIEDKDSCSHRTYKIEDNFYRARPATGGHDIVILKDHNKYLYTFTKTDWVDMLYVMRRRYNYWREDCNAEYTMAIYNQGIKGGASIKHPHAQIFTSNIIPNLVKREIDGSKVYFENEGQCAFCILISHEKVEKSRIIGENASFIAFTFYAARFPFEAWVLPKKHKNHFEEIEGTEIKDLAEIMESTIKKYKNILKEPPLNFFIHDLPRSLGQSDSYHWHLEIAPRVASYGGYEMGSGVIIDVMSPEEASDYLNGIKK